MSGNNDGDWFRLGPPTPVQQWNVDEYYQEHRNAQEANKPSELTIEILVAELKKEQKIRSDRDKQIKAYMLPLLYPSSPIAYSHLEHAEEFVANHRTSVQSLATAVNGFAEVMNSTKVNQILGQRWRALQNSIDESIGNEGTLQVALRGVNSALKGELDEQCRKKEYYKTKHASAQSQKDRLYEDLERALEVPDDLARLEGVDDKVTLKTLRALVESGVDGLRRITSQQSWTEPNDEDEDIMRENSLHDEAKADKTSDLATLTEHFYELLDQAKTNVMPVAGAETHVNRNPTANGSSIKEIAHLRGRLAVAEGLTADLITHNSQLQVEAESLRRQHQHSNAQDTENSDQEQAADKLETLDDDEIGTLMDLADSFQDSAEKFRQLLEDCEKHRAQDPTRNENALIVVLTTMIERAQKEVEDHKRTHGQGDGRLLRRLHFLLRHKNILIHENVPTEAEEERFFNLQEAVIERDERDLIAARQNIETNIPQDSVQGLVQRIERLAKDGENQKSGKSQGIDAQVLEFFNRLCTSMVERGTSMADYMEDFLRRDLPIRDSIQHDNGILIVKLDRLKRKLRKIKSPQNDGEDRDDDDDDSDSDSDSDGEAKAHPDDNLKAIKARLEGVEANGPEADASTLRRIVTRLARGVSLSNIAIEATRDAVRESDARKLVERDIVRYQTLWAHYTVHDVHLETDFNRLVQRARDVREELVQENNYNDLREREKTHQAQLKTIEDNAKRKQDACETLKKNLRERVAILEARLLERPTLPDLETEREIQKDLRDEIARLEQAIVHMTSENTRFRSLAERHQNLASLLSEQGHRLHQRMTEMQPPVEMPEWQHISPEALRATVQAVIDHLGSKHNPEQELNDIGKISDTNDQIRIEAEKALEQAQASLVQVQSELQAAQEGCEDRVKALQLALDNANEQLRQNEAALLQYDVSLNEALDETWQERRDREEAEAAAARRWQGRNDDDDDSSKSGSGRGTPKSSDSDNSDDPGNQGGNVGGAAGGDVDEEEPFDFGPEDETDNEPHNGPDAGSWNGEDSPSAGPSKRRGGRREEPCLRQHREQKEGGWRGKNFSPPSARSLGMTGLEIGGDFLDLSFLGEDDEETTPTSIRKRREREGLKSVKSDTPTPTSKADPTPTPGQKRKSIDDPANDPSNGSSSSSDSGNKKQKTDKDSEKPVVNPQPVDKDKPVDKKKPANKKTPAAKKKVTKPKSKKMKTPAKPKTRAPIKRSEEAIARAKANAQAMAAQKENQ